MRTLRVIPFLVLSLSACAHVGRHDFRCPAQGGTAWRELRSEHFLVQTDLPQGKARELAHELERMLGAVRYGLFRSPPPMPGKIRVVALRSNEEFDLFAPAGAEAFYDPSRVVGPTIVLPGALAEAQRLVIAHELTHHVLSRAFARQPLWFSEGTAAFMETMGGIGVPTLGGVPAWRYQSIFPYHGGIGPVLVAKDRLDDRQYGLAWALVHFLLNRQPREFGELQARFARGQDPAAAWREVFPLWDPAAPGGAERLDDEIGRYLASGKYGYKDVKLPPPTPASERAMTASEVHAARLSLRWMNRGKPVREGARLAEAEEALAEDPANVPALHVVAHARPAQALASARRAVELRPDDARAWLFLSERLPQDDAAGREEALRRAAQADPESAIALNNLAWALLGAGRSGEALPLARKAATLAPWDSATLDTLAGVMADLGQCAEALQVQRRAIDVLPEAAPGQVRREYTERLEHLEQTCRVSSSGSPAGAGAPAP
jgi:tetratricopeptide (TPR) repeat protein